MIALDAVVISLALLVLAVGCSSGRTSGDSRIVTATGRIGALHLDSAVPLRLPALRPVGIGAPCKELRRGDEEEPGDDERKKRAGPEDPQPALERDHHGGPDVECPWPGYRSSRT